MANEAQLPDELVIADDEVAIDYLKAPDFRISWVDGAISSISPEGKIHLISFSERPSIPRRQIFKLDEKTSTLGEEVVGKQVSRGSIVREMSTDLMMSVETAESLVVLLTEAINLANDVTESEKA